MLGASPGLWLAGAKGFDGLRIAEAPAWLLRVYLSIEVPEVGIGACRPAQTAVDGIRDNRHKLGFRMQLHPFSVSRPQVMAVPSCPAPALLALQPLVAGIVSWAPLDPGTAYGEGLVRAVVAALTELKPDLVLCPDPSDVDPVRRALTLACLEAARRTGGPECAWPLASSAAQADVALGWAVVRAGEFFESLLYLASGLLDDPAEPFAPTSPAADASVVSVIVRSMDRPSLQQTLASVALQTYRPIEVVLVNARGGEHGPLPEKVAGLAIKPVTSTNGLPLRRARAANAGLKAATGELALFLDDDDVLLPDHLSRLVAAARRHQDAPAVYADVELGRHGCGVWQPEHCFNAEFDEVRLLFENYLPIHAVLFRRELAQRQASFDEAFDLFEDWDFWLQLTQAGPFVHVPGVSARYIATQAPGHSAVFEDTPPARAARQALFEKWRQRLDPALYGQALTRLQALFRQVGQLQAGLADLQRGHAEQAAVLQAREADLAAYPPLLAAREAELANSRIEQQSQQLIRVTREQELANALTAIEAQAELLKHREGEVAGAAEYAASLRETLAHRERQIADGAEYAASLRETLTHREREIADALHQLADFRATLDAKQLTLSERDTELAHLRTELASLRTELAALRTELASLHAEKPLQALARTLRSKNKPHASRT